MRMALSADVVGGCGEAPPDVGGKESGVGWISARSGSTMEGSAEGEDFRGCSTSPSSSDIASSSSSMSSVDKVKVGPDIKLSL